MAKKKVGFTGADEDKYLEFIKAKIAAINDAKTPTAAIKAANEILDSNTNVAGVEAVTLRERLNKDKNNAVFAAIRGTVSVPKNLSVSSLAGWLVLYLIFDDVKETEAYQKWVLDNTNFKQDVSNKATYINALNFIKKHYYIFSKDIYNHEKIDGSSGATPEYLPITPKGWTVDFNNDSLVLKKGKRVVKTMLGDYKTSGRAYRNNEDKYVAGDDIEAWGLTATDGKTYMYMPIVDIFSIADAIYKITNAYNKGESTAKTKVSFKEKDQLNDADKKFIEEGGSHALIDNENKLQATKDTGVNDSFIIPKDIRLDIIKQYNNKLFSNNRKLFVKSNPHSISFYLDYPSTGKKVKRLFVATITQIGTREYNIWKGQYFKEKDNLGRDITMPYVERYKTKAYNFDEVANNNIRQTIEKMPVVFPKIPRETDVVFNNDLNAIINFRADKLLRYDASKRAQKNRRTALKERKARGAERTMQKKLANATTTSEPVNLATGKLPADVAKRVKSARGARGPYRPSVKHIRRSIAYRVARIEELRKMINQFKNTYNV